MTLGEVAATPPVAAAGPIDTGQPAAHPSISPDTVRKLLESQHPEFADHPVGERFDGWDMAMFRLGEALAVRLPRVEAAVASLEREIRCADLSHGWSFAHPRIVAHGTSGEGYPWPWAVVTWVPGATADGEPLSAAAGADAGLAIAQIHAPAPADAWFNPEQSLTMVERVGEVEWALATVAEKVGPGGATLDAEAAQAMWRAGVEAPATGPQVWSHADLHGSNLLSDLGAFAGIIDWGKMARCDRAVDLAFLYTAMPGDGVEVAFAAYRDATGVDDPGLEARARAIALHKCLVWATLDRPVNVAMAWRGFEALGVATEPA